MALVDIDRHILLELTGFVAEIKRLQGNLDGYWSQVIEVRDKTDALLFHAKPTKAQKETLWELRNMIFKATNRGARSLKQTNTHVAKLEALPLHLVSEIKSLDTGKGLETDENWRENKKKEVKEGRKAVRKLSKKPNWERDYVRGKGKRRYFKTDDRPNPADR